MESPRRHCSVSSSDDQNNLEFFKVFLPSFSSHQLQIPPDFAKQIKGKIPNKATVTDHTGRSWSVQLTKTRSGLFIKSGWEEFAAEHSLKFGDFLVFSYDHSSSDFHVKIFGKNGCKKERGCPVSKDPVVVKIEDDADDDDDDEVEESVEERGDGGRLKRPVRNCKRKYSDLDITKLHNPSRRKRPSEGFLREETSRSRLENQLVPKWPHFVTVISKDNTSRMLIPVSFMKEHGIKLKPTVMLRDQNGTLWPLSVPKKKGKFGFYNGWPETFQRENLQMEDKCLFEFVLGERNVCREVLFRVFRQGLRVQRRQRYWVLKE